MTKIIHYFETHGERILFQDAQQDVVRYSDVTELCRKPSFSRTYRKLVLCMAENDIGCLTGYLSLLAAGAVPMMLAANVSPHQLARLISAYRPHFLWLPRNRQAEFESSIHTEAFKRYSLLDLRQPEAEIFNSLALLLSTSGSTGSPKFVRLSADNILANAQAIAGYLDITENELPITTLPPSYSYGLSILHSHVIKGASIVLSGKTFFDRAFWNFLKEIGVTSFGGVPYHYEILKKLKFFRMELPSLRTLTQAGGRMPPDDTKEFGVGCAERGIRFFTMYGQVEATARMAYLPHNKTIEKAGSIGRAISGGEFWLEDECGRKMDGVDATGELVYRGPNVCLGYAEGFRDLARGDEFCGVLRTGDLARRDSDGDYYIIGRKKRFLKIYGHRINLQDVEDFLSKSGYQAACAGRDDSLEVYAVKAGESEGKPIKELLVAELKVAPAAVRVFGIPELPRNEAGKIQYSQLTPSAAIALA